MKSTFAENDFHQIQWKKLHFSIFFSERIVIDISGPFPKISYRWQLKTPSDFFIWNTQTSWKLSRHLCKSLRKLLEIHGLVWKNEKISIIHKPNIVTLEKQGKKLFSKANRSTVRFLKQRNTWRSINHKEENKPCGSEDTSWRL